MKLYLCGLKSYQLELRIECNAFPDLHGEKALQGIKCDHLGPHRRKRTPRTLPHLRLILNRIGNSRYDDLVLHAAFTLTFAAFLRVGEFTYRQSDLDSGRAFRNWSLTKSSIRFIAGGAHMELTIQSSKTDLFTHGVQLTIAASNDSASPVGAMNKPPSIDSHRPTHAPLFCIGPHEQRPLTS